MRRMRRLLTCGAMVLLAVPLIAQEPVDTAAIAKIRAEAYERGQVLDTFNQLANVIGPRLTNSPAHKRAVRWTEETLEKWGLANVHIEPFEFGRGWTLERFSVEMIEPRYMPLTGYPKGWSASTPGPITAAPVWLPKPSAADLQARAGKLAGAIVMTSPAQDYFIRADRPPASGDLRTGRPPAKPAMPLADLAAALKRENVGVTLEPNIGEHGTIFVTGRDAGANAIPAVVLVSEHYNLIARLLQQGIAVKLAVNVQAAFDESDRNTHNVIAEIPGTDPKLSAEVVMAGAHLDSWHSATGATDNADGVATVMEAARILKVLGVRPRRTIRIALWAGEEQGLLGARAWVKQHLEGEANAAERDRLSAYFNFDNGYPPVTGFYMEGNEPAQRIVSAWLKPLADLGVTATTSGGIGATDHLAFTALKLPGFQAVQSYVNYDVRTHHTNADFVERIEPEALKQAAVVTATVLYQAAMRDQKMPRQ
jgi:carboxypeptidase Q